MKLLHMLTLEFELVNQPSGTKNSLPGTKNSFLGPNFPKPVLTSVKQNDAVSSLSNRRWRRPSLKQRTLTKFVGGGLGGNE